MAKRTFAVLRLQPAADDPFPHPGLAGMYCLDADKPILRAAVYRASLDQAIYNNLIRFQDHYIARDVRVLRNNQPLVNMHVENIEQLPAIDNAIFEAPPDASRPPGRTILMSASSTTDHILHRKLPVYPAIAAAANIQGTVVLSGKISKEGHLENLRLIELAPAKRTP